MIRGAAVVTALALFSGLLAAQEASVFLGGTRARYADSVSGTGGFVALRLGTAQGLRAGRLEGAFSRFADAGWALQLGGQGTTLWRLGRDLWAGLSAGGTLNDFENGNASGTAAGGPLVVMTAGRSLVAVGLTGGAVRRLDSTWSALGGASLRWQVPAGAVTLDLGAGGTVADTLRFADLSVGLRAAWRAARLSAVLGARAGDLGEGAWGSLEAAWVPHPRVALEVMAGRYPPDLTGFAEGLYAQAGIRLYGWGTGRPRIAPRHALAVRADPRADGTVRLVLRLGRTARQVAIAGDWNGWEPVPLTRGDGGWVASLRLEPGIYKYALLADGEWILPDGVTGMDDGFGGKVAVLVVGRAEGQTGGR